MPHDPVEVLNRSLLLRVLFDLCLQIYGHPVACSTAQEMLQSIVSSICTKTISVSSPGIARYLLESDCTMFLSEMEEEFQVCISVNQQLWEPLAEQVALQQPKQ